MFLSKKQMAFFLPRKLLSDSINTTLSDSTCVFDCSESNYSQTCSFSCLNVCPNICKNTFQDFIYPSPPISHHHDGMKGISIVSISILASLFLISCFLTVCIKYKKRSRTEEQQRIVNSFLNQDRGPVADHPIWYIRTVGLHPSVIGSISVCRYKKGDSLVEGTECSVCLSQFEEDETLRILPKCNHAFHVNCIDPWLRSHTNCPLCRSPIVTNPSLGLSIRIPEETQTGIEQDDQESEIVVGETEEQSGEEDAIQQVRRSVSMDYSSASKISQTILDPNRSGFDPLRMEEPNRRGSSSVESGSVQNEPIFLKRSVSCNGKLMLPR